MNPSQTQDRRPWADRATAGLPILAAVATLAVVVSAAPAQDDAAALKPPQPDREPEAPAFLTLLSLLVVSGALIGASVLPSKRGHQD